MPEIFDAEFSTNVITAGGFVYTLPPTSSNLVTQTQLDSIAVSGNASLTYVNNTFTPTTQTQTLCASVSNLSSTLTQFYYDKNYIDGVTSNMSAAIDSKIDTIVGDALYAPLSGYNELTVLVADKAGFDYVDSMHSYAISRVEELSASRQFSFSSCQPFFEDYFNTVGNIGSVGMMSTGSANGGGISTVGGSAKHIGIIQAVCGTTSNSNGNAYVGALPSSSLISLGTSSCRGSLHLAFECRPGAILYTSANRGILYYGLFDAISATQTDAVCFKNTNGGTWQAITRSNSVETATTLTGYVAVANTWDIFEILIAYDASSVQFYINNTLVATHTTNIPIGTSRSLTYAFLSHKNSVHTSSCGFQIDWSYIKIGNENLTNGKLFNVRN